MQNVPFIVGGKHQSVVVSNPFPLWFPRNEGFVVKFKLLPYLSDVLSILFVMSLRAFPAMLMKLNFCFKSFDIPVA
jgi:hypothetical protein